MKEEPHHPHLFLGISICLIAFMFFVTASSLVWNFQGRFPTVQIIFIQNGVSFLCILPLALRKGHARLKTTVPQLHLLRDLFGVLSYYLYFVAIRYLNLVDATTLNYTAPFFVPLVWWIWTQEKIKSHVWWSIIIGFIGVAVILNPTKQIFQLGFLFGLFAGIASAVAFCAIRMLNLKKEPMSRTLFYYFLVGITLSAPFGWVYWIPPTSAEWLQALSIGVATALGQIFLTIAYRYGTASYLSPLGYSTVVYAGIISWWIFDQPLSLRSFLGTLLILAGGLATFALSRRGGIKQSLKVPRLEEKPPL